MNNETFLQEVLNSKLCPKNFEEIYEKFQFYQNKALQTLYEFHRVCEKNNIPYVLAYGSLLGLIRDGGQIPWDYDIDVMVPFEKREDLINALEKDLSPSYYYNYLNNNKKCRHMIMRLAPVGFRTEALHVDVFFMIGISKNDKESKKDSKIIRCISKIRFYKYVDIKFEGYKNLKHKLKLILFKILVFFIPMSLLMKKYYKICLKYPAMTSKRCCHADTFAPCLEFQYESKDIWDSFIKKVDSGQKLRIPKNYDSILKNHYGDYKKIPSLGKRIKEVIGNSERLMRSEINSEKNANI